MEEWESCGGGTATLIDYLFNFQEFIFGYVKTHEYFLFVNEYNLLCAFQEYLTGLNHWKG